MQRARLALSCLLALLLVYGIPVRATAQSSSDVHARINQAFIAIQDAEKAGGDVSPLVSTLSTAIRLTEQADSLHGSSPQAASQLYSQADALLSQVIKQAPSVADAGRVATQNTTIIFVGETISLGVLAVIAYLLTPRVFWRLWLRSHNDWRAKKT